MGFVYESISLNMSLINKLCNDNDFNSNLLVLSATCITLTKFNNSTEISVNVNDIPLMFNDENRERLVFDYITNIHKLSQSEESFFNISFNDVDNKYIKLSVFENSLNLKFNSDEYTNHYIRSFLKSINRVINQLGQYNLKELKIKDISLRDEEPVPDFKLLRNPLVNELLEAQANKTPDKIALRICGESYTFKQINDEANRIANALIKRGFKEQNSIAFLLKREKILITTFLGIIKAGCVAIPLDSNFAPEKLNYIMENSDSKYIITFEDFENSINPNDLIKECDASFPKVNLKPDSVIFLLYTSGSTGKPKGVISTHRGISNLISVHIKTNYKTLLSLSSISFDISEEDILVTLTNGMELIFADDDEINDIVLLSRLIDKTEPEFVNLTPSRLISYLQVPEFCNVFSKFKGIGCGGEPFTKNIYESIKKHADIVIYNGYGPLETSLTSNSKKIINPDYITNGRPLLNYVTDVRDIDGKLLPYGIIGELYIGGIGVSKGYYKLDEKTRETFITINGISYYRTGDNAIQLPSNNIIIKGRSDNQIKLRGQRVEPEEIEQVIFKYGNITNVVVMIQELNNEKHLCAYFTAKTKIDIEDLRNYLSNILSQYMFPTFFIQMKEFPETTSGKVDRKNFPKPKFETENVNSINIYEEKLYELCCNILNFNDFGVTDNLFKLGFTSLLLMKLNSDIYHEFDISLRHMDLMNNPTIREISNLIKNNLPVEKIEKIKDTQSGEYPMSSQQKRLYVLYRKNPNLCNYNLPNVRKFKKHLDINKLENAINKVINAEEILRTSLHIRNGEYIQKVHDKRDINVEFIKLDDNDDIFEVFKGYICPFNLEDEPLIRIKIIEHAGETYVFRDMHHILGDQISNDVLYDKIRDAYHNIPVYPNKIQYKDYTHWVKKQQDIEADYWRNKSVSDTGSLIYADFKRPSVQAFSGDRISHALDKKVLEKLAMDNNTTIFKLLLSQFIVLLNKYLNESDIQIGTITTGRTHPDVQSTLGMFVNTLPFIQSVSSEDTLKETLIKTENELSGLFDNQNYTIDMIISDHDVSVNSSYNPLFNIVFLQNTADGFENEVESDDLQFDLTCKLKNTESDLTVEFEYNRDVYSFDRINTLFNCFIYLIDNIDNNIDKRIKDIKILSPDYEEMIIEMAGSNQDVFHESVLHSFKKQVQQNPKKEILSDNNASINYEDLDLVTNSLANYLKDKCGVKKQDNVLLIADRSIESVLAFLSILKLNAVYVPVNPNFPKKRIQHIFDGLNANIILTNINIELDNVNIVDLKDKSIYKYDNNGIKFSCDGILSIIHTSGTTGNPKGVQITHKNIENFLISAENRFFCEDCKVFYHTTSIGFDTSLFEMLFSLLNGMQLYVIDESYDFSKVPESISKQKAFLNSVPSKLKMFFDIPYFDNVMKNVSQLVLAGSVLTENLVNEIRQKYHLTIYNAYGPCEATVFASIKKIPISNKVTIGKANINTQIYILNSERQICPIGVPGELCISGKQISDGYINKADLTDSVFIDNPFGDDKLYCTGDLAYIGYDGDIYFIGRIDSQIKINGQRIEVDEINKHIEKNKDIKFVITVPNTDKTCLFSYIVSDNIIDIDELLNELELALPSFMIPSSIMQMDNIPLNKNGKVDTKKLPTPEIHKIKYVPPTNDIEKLIIEIWQNILDVEHIGIHDNFYNLGGDSIKVIRTVSLLQRRGIVCPPNNILSYKTPYMIAKNVSYEKEVLYDHVGGDVDLLPIQKYFFEEVRRNNFTQQFILESKYDLNIDNLQKAFDELTNVHDMLRASFKMKNGMPLQEILPLNTRICEIKEFEFSQNLDESIKRVIMDANDSLDVFNRLIDVSLIRYEGKSYIIFVIHHLIIDGVSWSILLDDLTYILTQLYSDDKINIILPYSYKSWVSDVNNFVRNISIEEKQHWIEMNNLLDDSNIVGKPKLFKFYVENIKYNFDNSLMLSEEELFALAIARAYKMTYNKDFIINRESHGRDDTLANVNRTVGWFTTQYPVSIEVSCKYDDISLMFDALNLKMAFNKVNNLGLNYLSLIYSTGELKYKHCPVTFNFLSTEFTFKNELFESYELPIFGVIDESLDNVYYGIDFNILNLGDKYLFYGKCADNTYINNQLQEFIDNITNELEFLANNSFNSIICGLSESQLGIYLDEKANNMGIAYSTNHIIECDSNKSIDEIKMSILSVINKHPILKGRILDNEVYPILICDVSPKIDVIENDKPIILKEFDLEKSLSYFCIISSSDRKAIFFDVHHIINDMSGRKIIERDLIQALNNTLEEDIDLGFINAFKDSFNSQFESNYESAHEFYLNKLADIDEVNTLPEDVNGCKGVVSLRIPDISAQVREFAYSNSITLANLLNAVFAYTYSRFVGSGKVFFNITEHGRHQDYAQNAVGVFTRTIPIMVDCSNDQIKNYLRYVSDLALDSMENSIYPFRLLASKLNLNNDVLFEYNFDLNDVSHVDNLIVDDFDSDLVSQFTCVLNESMDDFVVSVYHSEKYSRETVIRFVNAYADILTQMLCKQHLSEIEYISDDDLVLLNSYNSTEHILEYNDILDAFNVNLSKYSESPLVCCNNIEYSYAESAFIADKIAGNLNDFKIKMNDKVAFLVERSELYVFCILGILSAGAIYVPLDSANPFNYINFVLEDTGAKVVIVSDKTYDYVKSFNNDFEILNISDIFRNEVETLSYLPVVYNDLACILYTSGTTGVPKGVEITRKAILNVSSSYVDSYNLTNGDVFGFFSSIGFDVSNFVIAVVLYSGACIAIVPEDIKLDMHLLNNYFIMHDVSHLFITTQVGKLFMESIDNTSLKVLLVAGEKLGEFKDPENYILVDAYGPTEAFAFNSSIEVKNKIDFSSVGKLNYNNKAYILDDEFRRVPIGAVGELYLSGYQVAEGYLNCKKESARVFMDNPFDGGSYSKMYRTGDLVRVLSDGTLAIMGRCDNQVKVRGNRVELSEVESCIREIDAVEDITVQIFNVGGNDELVAYVVVNDDIDEDDIRNYVLENKIEYMVPSIIMFLDEIPLTVNFKVDKRALLDVNLDNLQTDYVGAGNEIEQVIMDAFEVAFNQKGIGLYDDFVNLGGNSITAIRLISLLQKNNVYCTTRDILNYKTPYLIAQNIEDLNTVSHDDVEGKVDLLPIQSHYFEHIHKNDYAQYFILKSNEKINIKILQDAFNELVNIHDMLRASYEFNNGVPVQKISKSNETTYKIKEHTISKDFNSQINEIYNNSINSLNIKNKLIDINLIHDKTDYILLVLHHLIVDGVSWNILLSDLTHIYLNLIEGKESVLIKPYPYKNWVNDVETLVNNISPKEKEHWMKINDLLDDSEIKGKGKNFNFKINTKYNVNNLLMLNEEEYLALAIARAYKKTYGKDIIFNCESYGRDDNIADLNRTVGWFTSQYPVSVKINGNYDDISLIKDVYKIKTSFKKINNLGLNYSSLVYITNELEYKHCPVTFNFLSTEFTFKNSLFESINQNLTRNKKINDNVHGIDLNISRIDNFYYFEGDYPENTFISDKIVSFIKNIKSELKFLAEYKFKNNNIICNLSEPQLEVYINEKEHNMGTAYSTWESIKCPSNLSIAEIENAIHNFINKHPILKGRILDDGKMPFLICDSYPLIEITDNNNPSDLIKKFDLEKYLARFFIINKKDYRYVFYDIHHIINDGVGFSIIKKELTDALNGNLNNNPDFGFVNASYDSFESQFSPAYQSAHKFYCEQLHKIKEARPLQKSYNGSHIMISLPIRNIKNRVEEFTQNNNISVGTFLNAVFAYTYSIFVKSTKVYYNFVEHGRHETYAQNALGMFARTVPVLIDCKDDDINSYLSYFSNLILNSMLNSIYPFRLLKKEFNLNNDVLFEYNYDLNDVSNIKDETIVKKDCIDAFAEFFCIINDLDDGYVIHIKQTNKFSKNTAIDFTELYVKILDQMLNKKRLSEINY